jgi:hypothetical protein
MGIYWSDPQLSSMMAIFGRLAAGQDMPAHEREPGAVARLLTAVLVALAAVLAVAVAVARACARRLTSPAPARSVPYGPPGASWPSPPTYMPWYWYR